MLQQLDLCKSASEMTAGSCFLGTQAHSIQLLLFLYEYYILELRQSFSQVFFSILCKIFPLARTPVGLLLIVGLIAFVKRSLMEFIIGCIIWKEFYHFFMVCI